MSYLRFNHVFFGLMALSFISAFVITPRITDRPRSHVQNIFAPVAYPVRRIAGGIHNTMSPQHARDDGSPANPRTSNDVLNENSRLRIELANVRAQVTGLQLRERERAAIGDLRKLCTPINVVGGDSGARESLLLQTSSFDDVKEKMAVLYPGGIAGRISRVGAGGATAQLVTDPQSKLEAVFARLITKADGSPDFQWLSAQPVLVVGAGRGMMTAQLTDKDAGAGEMRLRANDWVVLSDRDWPPELDRYRVGYVESIVNERDPGFVRVSIKPGQSLMGLQEVMVMNKEK